MDPAVANIITAVIAALCGGTGQHFLTSWKEARRGRLDEAQRIAQRADRLQAKLRLWQGFAYTWREHAAIIRFRAAAAGIDLPPTPPQEPNLEEK